MRSISLGLALVILAACSHEVDHTQLDIASHPEVAEGQKFDGADPSKLEPEKIFEWQKYYKNPPTSTDRAAITSSIDKNAQSGSVEARLKAARNALAIGDRTKSKEIYTNILRDDSDQLDAQIEMAHIYLAENDTERAFDYLTSVKKVLDKTERPAKDYTIRYRYALAQAYIKAQNKAQGHQILTDLIELEPKFGMAYAALAQSYIEDSKTELAEFIIKRGLDQDGSDPRLMNLLAVLHLRAGRLPEAREWINKALNRDPNFVPALVNRAQLSMQRREYALAENDLKKACELEPLNPDAYITKGLLYRQTGRVTAAKTSFEHAMDIAPLNPLARYQMANLMHEEFKDKTTALQLYYDVLSAQDQELKNLANMQIQSIRDSRLYQ